MSSIDVFTRRLHAEWLPAFCNAPKRGYGVAGFRPASIRVSELDAANFLRAIDGGLIEHVGDGQYRCAQSKALEQLFWQLDKDTSPRPVVLWMEPVIGFATIARLHYDLRWPLERIGMQSADYAFDFVGYAASGATVLAGEVKKSRAEIDHMLADLYAHSAGRTEAPLSQSGRHKNSFKKWLALRNSRPTHFWAVGPEGYEHAFRVEHDEGSTQLVPVTLESLKFTEQ